LIALDNAGRELYRIQRATETPEESKERRRRRRVYMRRRRENTDREEERRRNREYNQRRRVNIASEQHQNAFQLHSEHPEHSSSLIPSFNDPAVMAKMRKFYDDLNSLECNVQCVEQFPFITLTANNLCARCHRDKHDPKLYSACNNMDPGSLPIELMVCALNMHAYKLHVCVFYLAVGMYAPVTFYTVLFRV